MQTPSSAPSPLSQEPCRRGRKLQQALGGNSDTQRGSWNRWSHSQAISFVTNWLDGMVFGCSFPIRVWSWMRNDTELSRLFNVLSGTALQLSWSVLTLTSSERMGCYLNRSVLLRDWIQALHLGRGCHQRVLYPDVSSEALMWGAPTLTMSASSPHMWLGWCLYWKVTFYPN